MPDLKEIVQEHQTLVSKTRQDLHRIPEPAYKETKTAAYIADYLQREDLQVQTGVAHTGVVGLLQTGRPGKTLLIRSDMDALEIAEETGLPFASEHEGHMHACGHDCHMAMVLGTASVLNKLRDRLTGNVKFIFQPAEEGPGGAKPMIDAGVMANPQVDYCIGCHVWPTLPEGTVGVKAGPFMAAMDRFDIRIIGKGGHGAMPNHCIDALEVGTQVVSALQRIVSRHMDPLTPTVVTVGSFHAGTAFNIIPEEAELSGTTRTFDREVWATWAQRLETIVRGVCQSMGADYQLHYSQGYPPLVNHERMTEVVRRCAETAIGKEKVVEARPTMGGEDMAFFLEHAPGCYYCLGAGFEGCSGIHTSRLIVPEAILLTGIEIYCRAALELLGT